MKISTFIISILLISLVVTAFANFYSGVSDEYSVTFDSETNDTIRGLDKFEEIQNITYDMEQQLFNSSQQGDNTDLLGTFLGSGFNVLKIAKASFSAFGSMVTSIGGDIGVPGYIISILIAIALVIVIFIIISALVGKNL